MTPVHENLKGEEAPRIEESTSKNETAKTEEAEGTKSNEEDSAPPIEAVKEEKTTIGEEAETYSSAIVRIELVTGDPPFRRNPNHDAIEFQRQIEGQEAGMNNLTVEEFINNRDAYLENGRSSEGSAAQQRYREPQFREGMMTLSRQVCKLKSWGLDFYNLSLFSKISINWFKTIPQF